MDTFLWIFIGGLLMSAVALVGSVSFFLSPATLDRLILPLVSLAAGTLLGGAFFHMIPAVIDRVGAVNGAVYLLSGFSVFLGMEQFLHWHHSHHVPENNHKPMTYLILIGDGLHNFLGGLAIASTFIINPTAGIIAWFAAVAHEVPQELGDFGILIHGGWSRRQALIWNFISALTFPVGALCSFALSRQLQLDGLVLFGAGSFIYIAASDLVPEIKAHRDMSKAAVSFVVFLFGVFFMYCLAYFFGH
jgi:zinc and cadmium transporter